MTRTLQRERHSWNQSSPPPSLASIGAELSGTKNYHLDDVVAFLAHAPPTSAPNGTFRWFFKAFFLNTRDHLDGKIKLWTLSLSVTNSFSWYAVSELIRGEVKAHSTVRAGTVPLLSQYSQTQGLHQSRQNRCCHKILLKLGGKTTLNCLLWTKWEGGGGINHTPKGIY